MSQLLSEITAKRRVLLASNPNLTSVRLEQQNKVSLLSFKTRNPWLSFETHCITYSLGSLCYFKELLLNSTLRFPYSFIALSLHTKCFVVI